MKRDLEIRTGLRTPAEMGSAYLLSALAKQSDQKLYHRWAADYIRPKPRGGYAETLSGKQIAQGKLIVPWTFSLMTPLMYAYFCTQYPKGSAVTIKTYDRETAVYIQAIIQHPNDETMLAKHYSGVTFTFVKGVIVT